MSEITLQANIRNKETEKLGSLRTNGSIPGIYYGHGEENILFSATQLDMRSIIFTSDTHIIELKLNNGVTKRCVLRDVQFDPVTDKAIHVDFQGIKEDEELKISIPIILKGSAQGVKDGGMLQHNMHSLHISCLPKYIPEHIEVDISNLMVNDSIHVSDLNLQNITILDNLKNNIVGVVPPTVLKEETPAEIAAAPTEPELITKGKKAEEGEETADSKETKTETKK